MSIQLSYTGSEYTTPDHAVGYGTAISTPATFLSNLVTSQLYFQEAGGDIDVIFVKGGDRFLCSFYKSFLNQKMLQQFVLSVTTVSGQERIRLIHRGLASTFTLEQGLRAVGANIIVSDDYSDMATINQQLAPLWIQVYKA